MFGFKENEICYKIKGTFHNPFTALEHNQSLYHKIPGWIDIGQVIVFGLISSAKLLTIQAQSSQRMDLRQH